MEVDALSTERGEEKSERNKREKYHPETVERSSRV